MDRTENAPFLSDIRTIETGLDAARLICARFHLEQFRADSFARLAIPCPPSLLPAADKRKAEFLAGRAMAQRALQELNQPPAELPIGPSRAPLWPRGLHGSISHARGHCAALVTTAPNTHIGVDIEAYASDRALEAIRKTVLDETERHLTEALADDRLATLIFSAKETLFKALHPSVQCHFGFDAARLIAPPADGRARFALTRSLHPRHREGDRFDIRFQLGPDHLVTWLAVPAS